MSGKLLVFLRRLDHEVTIHVAPHEPGGPYDEVDHGA
jgi:hypothetical protein